MKLFSGNRKKHDDAWDNDDFKDEEYSDSYDDDDDDSGGDYDNGYDDSDNDDYDYVSEYDGEDDFYLKRSPEEQREIEAMIARYQKRKMVKRIVLLIFLIAIFAGGYFAYNHYIKPPASSAGGKKANPSATLPPVRAAAVIDDSNRKEDFYTFAIVGKDDGNGGTDTMIVGSFDARNKKLNLVNIPRDTMVNVPWGLKKANTILADEGDDSGDLVAGIRDVAGFTVDSYIIVSLEAFVKLVNTIGGVYFDVPIDMDYDDPLQDLHIHLYSGYQYLDGDSAVGVVRFRKNNDGSGYPAADIQRIETQQNFLKEVARQLLSVGNITKVNEFAQIFKEYTETDMTFGNIVWYGTQFLSMEIENFSFHTLPAEYNDSYYGVSYCIVYLDEWLKMINECLNPYKEEITEAHLNVLTRDSEGDLYATNGVVAGGYESFMGYYSSYDDDYEDYSGYESYEDYENYSGGDYEDWTDDGESDDYNEESDESEDEFEALPPGFSEDDLIPPEHGDGPETSIDENENIEDSETDNDEE